METTEPFGLCTIQSAIPLSEWAEEHPQELRRLEHLGVSKLHMLAPLAPTAAASSPEACGW